MRLTSSHRPAKLRRISKPLTVAITVILVLMFSTLGFFAGRYFQPPDLAAINQSNEPIPVWSPVENRTVDDRQSYAAVVKAGSTIPIPARSSIEPAVVVKQGLTAGAQAQNGSLAGVISGQPYFLLPEPLPLYRNLKAGDFGDDVLALQYSMNAAGYTVEESGIVDSLLLSQVAALFESDGYKIPTSSQENKTVDPSTIMPNPKYSDDGTGNDSEKEIFIPYLQLLPIPATGGTVVSALPVGSVVSGDSPLLNLRTSENYVEFIADVTQVQALKVGQELTVRVGTKEAKAKISSIGDFTDGKEGQKSGSPVRLFVNDISISSSLTENLSLTVLSDGGTSEGLAVPLAAIKQDASGPYVEKRSKESTTVKTSIKILKSGGGYAAISGDIELGDEVLFS